MAAPHSEIDAAALLSLRGELTGPADVNHLDEDGLRSVYDRLVAAGASGLPRFATSAKRLADLESAIIDTLWPDDDTTFATDTDAFTDVTETGASSSRPPRRTRTPRAKRGKKAVTVVSPKPAGSASPPGLVSQEEKDAIAAAKAASLVPQASASEAATQAAAGEVTLAELLAAVKRVTQDVEGLKRSSTTQPMLPGNVHRAAPAGGPAAPARQLGVPRVRRCCLHVTERAAPGILATTDATGGTFTSVTAATTMRHHRNKRDLMTIARVIDLLRDELGTTTADSLDAMETLTRRWWAITLADASGEKSFRKAWAVAQEVEEVPQDGVFGGPQNILVAARKSARLKQQVMSSNLKDDKSESA